MRLVPLLPGAQPRMVIRPKPGRPDSIRTVLGRSPSTGTVTSRVLASSSRCIGGSEATPWLMSVRHTSMGSPPGPIRGKSTSRWAGLVATLRSPDDESENGDDDVDRQATGHQHGSDGARDGGAA